MRMALLAMLVLAPLKKAIAESYAQRVLKQHIAEQFLKTHNKVRLTHGLSLLEWDEDIALAAQYFVKRLSNDCKANPSSTALYSELIYQSWGAFPMTPRSVVNRWVSQKNHYKDQDNLCQNEYEEDENNPIFIEKTKKIGCSYKNCRDTKTDAMSMIYVCRYFPKTI